MLVAVYSRDGYVLLIERRRPFRFWQSVTGSLEPGETPEDAARRELEEETGLTREGRLHTLGLSRQFTIDPRWLGNYAPGVRENVEYEWRYELDERRDVRLAADEHTAFQWLPLSQAAATVWSWTNREALNSLPIRSAPSVP